MTREAKSVDWHVVRAELDPNDHEAYWRLLARYWAEGEGLTIVEQDVVPPWGAFEQFASCPEDFCAFPYPCGSGRALLALGCTRFSMSLTKEFPQAIDLAGEITEDALNLPKRHWKRLDTRIYRTLLEVGGRFDSYPRYECHPHEPIATHLHLY